MSSTTSELCAYLLLLWVLTAAALVIVLTYGDNQRQAFKAEAVKRGAAEWVVDPKTGDTKFAWKDQP